jgi:hypothetical protein
MAQPTPQTRHFITRRLRAMVRLAIVLVMVLLVVFAGGALFLASSSGKALALRTLSASLRSQLGVEGRAARLDYRPGALGVTLHAVNIRQPGAARAFLNVERVEVDFSPAVFRGTLVLRRLDITKPEVVLDSTTQGASAVGREGQRSSITVPSFDIQSGQVRDFTLTSVSPNGTHIAVRGLSLSFTGGGPGVARGVAVVSGGWSVRRGSAAMGFDRARADVSLAGTSLALTSIAMESAVAAIGGTASLDVSRGDLDVKYDARVALDELRTWSPKVPPLGGELEASGAIGGTLAHPVASFEGRIKRFQWQEVTDASVLAAGRWSGTDLTIDRYSVSSRVMGATLNGSARLAVGDDQGSSSLRAEASVENARRLAPVTRTSALPAAPLTLVADLRWSGPEPGPESLGGRVQIAVVNATPLRAAIATADAIGERGHWRVQSRAALDGDTSLAADISVLLDRVNLPQSTVSGRFGARSATLESAVRDLRRNGFLPADFGAVLQGGRATAEGLLTGTLSSPRLEARLSADSLTLGGVEHVRAEAQVRLEGRAVEITRMRAEASGNRVDVTGTATAGNGPIHLAVNARLDRPEILAAALPAGWRPSGLLVGSGTLNGSWTDPQLAARVSGDAAIGGRALGPVEVTARSADRAVRFDVALPALSADLTGRVGFETGWPFEARANLRKSPLTSLAALLDKATALPDTSATVTASADVKGQLDRLPASTAVVSVPEIEGQLRGRPLRLIQPGRLRFDGRRPTVEEPFRITLGGFSIGLARVRDSENGVTVTLDGRIEDGLAFLPPDTATPWRVEGPVRAQVSLNPDGDRVAIAGHGDATIDRLMRAEGEIARGVHLQARILGSAIEFSGDEGVVLGAPFSAAGRMPLAWAVPAWVGESAAARGDLSPMAATVSARSDARLAPALQALGVKNTANMSGTAKIAIEAHAAAPRLTLSWPRPPSRLPRSRSTISPLPSRHRPACDSIEDGWKSEHSIGKDRGRSSRPRARSAFCQAPKESFGPKGTRHWRFSR